MEINQLLRSLQEIIDRTHCGEFVWQIDNLSGKIQRARNSRDREISSHVFYSHQNGYKMCLTVYAGPTALWFYYCIMIGPFDNILRWPFNRDIELSLINQRTGLVETSWTYKCWKYAALEKPTTENNKKRFGYNYAFVPIEQILNNPDLSQNNKIFIKCYVKPGENEH